jgi:hypothetical protein
MEILIDFWWLWKIDPHTEKERSVEIKEERIGRLIDSGRDEWNEGNFGFSNFNYLLFFLRTDNLIIGYKLQSVIERKIQARKSLAARVRALTSHDKH